MTLGGIKTTAVQPRTPKTTDALASERTDLAVERTVMAAGRNLMAWIRTGLSLISFGFTIYKFLEASVAEKGTDIMLKAHPRRIGLTLIAMGTGAVVLGAVEYFETLRRMDTLSERKYRPLNFSFILGMFVGLFGLFLFITILTHTEVF